jgi:hypothetical protein
LLSSYVKRLLDSLMLEMKAGLFPERFLDIRLYDSVAAVRGVFHQLPPKTWA